eukprot:CAMPEP_0115169534 /NCGR_PEP_ID=MMETSP0270-20121206/1317_1 /TAXON_ID=71861 /ORGANISM="Scrippsiella trochoidea, Strain CCMP3099" /LENGTH=461 /DNA_ID=CAMNT_0002582233 /DNA_START=1 /DNA_END=1383 /DNA_ORIENTATION=-
MPKEHPCGNQTNNFASFTLASLDTPVRVEVTLVVDERARKRYKHPPVAIARQGYCRTHRRAQILRGEDDRIRHHSTMPGVRRDGDEDLLFPDEDAYYRFADLLLFINPPVALMPHQFPIVTGSSCTSSEPDRSCVIANTDDDCDLNITVGIDQDLLFRHSGGDGLTYYKWGDGCGYDPKKIGLMSGARVFLEENVVVYARIVSEGGEGTGVYGYGIVSNQFMGGHKNISTASNVIDLNGNSSEVFGAVVLDSVYRNVQLGAWSSASYMKVLSWNMETDCVNMLSSGGRIDNNFFKANDDCLKAYQMDSIYTDNVIWHQDVGRALMFSWGNKGEAVNTDGSVIFRDTFIIHDQVGFRRATVFPTADVPLGLQAGMMYYSSLINAQHSPSNRIGMEDSPVYIENLVIESRVGSILLITNGFYALDNKAPWMYKDGCTGPVFLRINGLDLSRLKGQAAPSVVGG